VAGRHQLVDAGVYPHGSLGVGGSMIVYLSGLQSDSYGAVRGGVDRRRQPYPAVLGPSRCDAESDHLLQLGHGLIGAFQIFENAYIMTSVGPKLTGPTSRPQYLRQSFRSLRFGYSSTLG